MSSWLGWVRAAPVDSVNTEDLAAVAALHYHYRFDPKGLTPWEREALRVGVRAWLQRHLAPRTDQLPPAPG